MEKLKLHKWSLLALAVLGTSPAMAEGLNYNYIEAAYVDTEIDDNSFDIDGDGIALGGSVELGETMFLTAGYSAQEFDFGIDVDQWSVGIGGHIPISDGIDLIGTLSYIDAEVDTRFGSFDDSGYGLSVGVRARITDNVELEGGINYVDLDDVGDDTTFGVGGRYYFTPEFALGAGFAVGSDASAWSIGVRYEFP